MAAIVRCCAAADAPMTPFGAGVAGGAHRRAARRDLHPLLGERGLFFRSTRGRTPTVGGMVATGASGTMTLRYGTMRETVLSLEVVLADGQVS